MIFGRKVKGKWHFCLRSKTLIGVLHLEIDQLVKNFPGGFYLSVKKEDPKDIIQQCQTETNTSVDCISFHTEIKPRKTDQNNAPKTHKESGHWKQAIPDKDDAAPRGGFDFPCDQRQE